jgi:hypothetical protein
MHLYEDLIAVNRSARLIEAAIDRKDRVLNVQNKRRGVAARRGDGTFGEIIPGETPITDAGYLVSRGAIATVEIGIEMKVLAKAMIKQIDRVMNDLRNQVIQFKRGGAPEFDEFLMLRFKATNVPPYPFKWVNYKETRLDYAAALSRISARYQQRF